MTKPKGEKRAWNDFVTEEDLIKMIPEEILRRAREIKARRKKGWRIGDNSHLEEQYRK